MAITSTPQAIAPPAPQVVIIPAASLSLRQQQEGRRPYPGDLGFEVKEVSSFLTEGGMTTRVYLPDRTYVQHYVVREDERRRRFGDCMTNFMIKHLVDPTYVVHRERFEIGNTGLYGVVETSIDNPAVGLTGELAAYTGEVRRLLA